MSHRKRSSKLKHWRKALPALGIAGMSLAMASRAPASTAETKLDITPHNIVSNDEITLSEGEIFDVSLGSFHLFDKENTATQPRVQLARGGGGRCRTGGGPPHRGRSGSFGGGGRSRH
jgi:hypothetical protein